MYRTCGYHALVPETLKVLINYDGEGGPLFRGGFADVSVWKGESFGRAVAVKVIRTDSKSGLHKEVHRGKLLVAPISVYRVPQMLSRGFAKKS